MPQVYNGIGTWYWGKSNVLVRDDFCPACNNYVHLRSYDTTRFFVFFFLPVFPMGKRRVVDECPVCTQHRAMKLADWNRGRSEEVPAVLDEWRRKPTDMNTVKAALATTLTLQDEAAFLEVADGLGVTGSDDAEFLAALADAYEYFGKLESAESTYRKSLAVKANPAVRDALALNLLRQSRPDAAWPLLQEALTEERVESIGLLYAAAESYQSWGMHDQTLFIADQSFAAFPQLLKDRSWKRMREVSEKNLASGKPIKSKSLEPKKKVDVAGNRFFSSLARLVVPIVLLVGVIAYLLAAYQAGQAREVIVVNGLDIGYAVEISGHRCELMPFGRRTVTIPEGEVTVRVLTAGVPIPDQTCRIATSFMARPVQDHTFLINPDRCALIAWEETTYREHPSPADDAPFEVYIGETLIPFQNVDYPFREFPDSIKVQGSGAVKKRRIEQVREVPLVSVFQLLVDRHGVEHAVSVFRGMPFRAPREAERLAAMIQALSAEQALELLDSMRSDRPVRTEAHRYYQEFAERLRPEQDLEAEYRSLLEQEPDNPALCYLAARVETDRARSQQLLQKAAASEPPFVRAVGALGYDRMVTGDFESALDYFRQCRQLAPAAEDFRTYEFEMLGALGRFDEVLDGSRWGKSRNGQRDEDVVTEIRVLATMGRTQDAIARVQEYIKEHQEHLEDEALTALRRVLMAEIHYIEGNLEAYATNWATTEGSAPNALVALSMGDMAAVDAAIEAEQDAGGMALLQAYIRGAHAGDTERAEAFLARSIEALGGGDADERQLAIWLAANAPPSDADPLGMGMHPTQKRTALVALGLRFPSLRDACFELARKLNYNREFPRLMLKAVMEGRPIEVRPIPTVGTVDKSDTDG